MTPFRIGFGYDVHRLSPGESLVLGGVKIPHTQGTVAHSDGDAVIHALCDALLGAANLRDIGYHFPDTDPRWKNADSKNLLAKTAQLIANEGYRVGNADITIVLQKPKIKDFIEEMKVLMALNMQVHPSAISVKATTTEKLGFAGEEKGVASYAVALIYKEKTDSE